MEETSLEVNCEERSMIWRLGLFSVVRSRQIVSLLYFSSYFLFQFSSLVPNSSLVISFLVTAVRNREERKREYVPVQESRNVFRNGGVDV